MITVQNLCKTYKVAKRKAGMKEACRSLFRREYEEIHALDHISFRIEDGETIGYIGPNGAGKSTSIKVLSGILTPDEGTCVVNGKIPWKDRISYVKDIGVVFGQRSQLWGDVPVIDSFELLRDIYSIPQAMYKNNLEELTELLNLSELLKTPARQLSLGQRMRCEIAASLLHKTGQPAVSYEWPMPKYILLRHPPLHERSQSFVPDIFLFFLLRTFVTPSDTPRPG